MLLLLLPRPPPKSDDGSGISFFNADRNRPYINELQWHSVGETVRHKRVIAARVWRSVGRRSSPAAKRHGGGGAKQCCTTVRAATTGRTEGRGRPAGGGSASTHNGKFVKTHPSAICNITNRRPGYARGCNGLTTGDGAPAAFVRPSGALRPLARRSVGRRRCRPFDRRAKFGGSGVASARSSHLPTERLLRLGVFRFSRFRDGGYRVCCVQFDAELASSCRSRKNEYVSPEGALLHGAVTWECLF